MGIKFYGTTAQNSQVSLQIGRKALPRRWHTRVRIYEAAEGWDIPGQFLNCFPDCKWELPTLFHHVICKLLCEWKLLMLRVTEVCEQPRTYLPTLFLWQWIDYFPRIKYSFLCINWQGVLWCYSYVFLEWLKESFLPCCFKL